MRPPPPEPEPSVGGSIAAAAGARRVGATVAGHEPCLPGFADSPAAMLWVGADGTVLTANAAACALFAARGRPPTGLPVAELLHPADRTGLARRLREAGGITEEALRVRWIDQERRSHWIELWPWRLGPAGAERRDGLLFIVSPASERVRREGRDAARMRTLSSLIDNLPGLVYRGRNNRDWSMEFISAGCEALTGWDAESMIDGRRLHFGDIIHPEDRDHVWAAVQRSLDERRPFYIHYRIVRREGTVCWVHEYGRGNYAEGGELLGLDGFITAADAHVGVDHTVGDGLRDADTGLPVAALFTDRLEEAARLAALPDRPPCHLVEFRFSRLERESAALGDAGRRALRVALARRLANLVTPSTSVSDFGDGRYLALLHGVAPEDLAGWIARAERGLRAPLVFGERMLWVQARVSAEQVRPPGEASGPLAEPLVARR